MYELKCRHLSIKYTYCKCSKTQINVRTVLMKIREKRREEGGGRIRQKHYPLGHGTFCALGSHWLHDPLSGYIYLVHFVHSTALTWFQFFSFFFFFFFFTASTNSYGSVCRVPPPVSVTVLPWLHHAHCSLEGDIILLAGISECGPVQCNRNTRYGGRYWSLLRFHGDSFSPLRVIEKDIIFCIQ